MSANPYESPETVGYVPQAKSKLPKLVLRLLAAMTIVAVLVALLLPSQRGSREAARRMHCANNLKRIALALQSYESTYHCLPPAYTVDAAGKPLHSWRTLILPFMEGKRALYEQIDLSKPWDDPANRVAANSGVLVYRCPSGATGCNETTYLAIVAPGGCFKPTDSRPIAQVTDRKDLTLMVIDVPDEHAVHWMSPTDASEELVLSLGAARTLQHPNGTMVALVSGEVRFFSKESPAAMLRALISIAGNDDDIAKVLVD